MTNSKTKIICLAALKGGVSKTTTSLSLAFGMAQEKDKKVLLIDMDSQSSASIIVGITPNNYDKRTPFDNISEALKRVEHEDLSYEIDPLDKVDEESNDAFKVDGVHTLFEYMMEERTTDLNFDLVNSCIHSPSFKQVEHLLDENGIAVKDEYGQIKKVDKYYYFGFDVMPSTEYLSDIELTWSNSGRSSDKGRQLSVITEFIKKNYDYDYIIIDCPPALGLLTINAIYASDDGVIIPVSQDKQSIFSLERMKRVVAKVKSFKAGHNGVLGVLLTIFNKKRLVDRYISLTVGHDLRLNVFNTKISEANDAKKALMSGQILPQVNLRNYEETIALINEIEDLIEGKENGENNE